MQFIYDEKASQSSLIITGESHKYLFKVRRLKLFDIVKLRNLIDDNLYRYEIVDIRKKDALLKLVDFKHDIKSSYKKFHLLWCIVDPKVIYQTLPMLNQIGVFKITFIYCERSQKNYKIDLDKCKRILINSSQQSGRTEFMKIEIIDSLDKAIDIYKDFAVLDFGGDKDYKDISRVLIGCEGGFSKVEREKLQTHYKIGLNTDLILKSETAALTIVSKLLI